MWEYEKLLKVLRTVPWRLVYWVIGASFIMAQVTSFLASYIFMPKFQSTQTLPMAPGEAAFAMSAVESLTKDDIKIIYDRNIFNSDGTLGDVDPKSPEGQEQMSSEAVKTDLPLKLLGLIYGGTPFNGLATIENTQKNKINSFIVGDALTKEAKVSEIHRTRVYIDRGGRREFLELDQPALVRSSRKAKKAATPVGGDAAAPIATGPAVKNYKEEGFEFDGSAHKVTMSDSFKQKLLGPDFTRVLQDAKAMPHMVDGQVKGFKLTRIREGSIYHKAGLQNDDVVEEINGTPLRDAASAIRLLQGLRNASEIEVMVKRDGAVFPMTLTVQ